MTISEAMAASKPWLRPRLLLPPGGRRKRGGSGGENGVRGLASPHAIFGAMLVLGVARAVLWISGRRLLVCSRIQLRLVRQWLHVWRPSCVSTALLYLTVTCSWCPTLCFRFQRFLVRQWLHVTVSLQRPGNFTHFLREGGPQFLILRSILAGFAGYDAPRAVFPSAGPCFPAPWLVWTRRTVSTYTCACLMKPVAIPQVQFLDKVICPSLLRLVLWPGQR